VLALIARFTLKEPRLVGSKVLGAQVVSAEHVGIATTSAILWNNRSFRHLSLWFAVSSFFGFGMAQWQSAYFIREYGFKTGELGSLFAVVGALTAPMTYLGGKLASRYAANNECLQLKAIGLITAASSIISAIAFASTNQYMSLGLTAASAIVSGLCSGPLFATLQTIVPNRMRATSIAMIYFFANLIGMGLGPLAAGVISDAFRVWFGQESLRYALVALSPGYLWAGWHAWRASQSVMSDIDKLHGERQPNKLCPLEAAAR